MYRVLRRFEDLQDDRHLYQPGDEFPRAGLKVSEERIDELCTSKNKRRVPLIKFEKDSQKETKFAESVKSEVDEEITKKIKEVAASEHAENATEAALEEPEQLEVVESKPKRKRAKKEQ